MKICSNGKLGKSQIIHGELLTANIHQVRPGDKSTSVINYYDGSTVTIPLDPRLSPSKNAQQYFKKYGKAKTAVKGEAAPVKNKRKLI